MVSTQEIVKPDPPLKTTRDASIDDGNTVNKEISNEAEIESEVKSIEETGGRGGPLSNTIFPQNLTFPLSNTGVTQWFLDTKKVLLRGKEFLWI